MRNILAKKRLARFDLEVIKPLFLRSEGLSHTLHTLCTSPMVRN